MAKSQQITKSILKSDAKIIIEKIDINSTEVQEEIKRIRTEQEKILARKIIDRKSLELEITI